MHSNLPKELLFNLVMLRMALVLTSNLMLRMRVLTKEDLLQVLRNMQGHHLNLYQQTLLNESEASNTIAI